MPAVQRIGAHLRRHTIGYLAVFVALTATSYARTKITTKEIRKNAITSNTAGVAERFSCDYSLNGAAPGAAGVTAIATSAVGVYAVTPVAALSAGSTLGIRCRVDDSLGGQTANDVVRIHSIEFSYLSNR